MSLKNRTSSRCNFQFHKKKKNYCFFRKNKIKKLFFYYFFVKCLKNIYTNTAYIQIKKNSHYTGSTITPRLILLPFLFIEFYNVDQATVFEILLAANYLDIKCLYKAGCKSVAKMIRGKSPEELRKQFNSENDFTTEEEEKIKQENQWCMEEKF